MTTSSETPSAAERAVTHLVVQMQRNADLGYQIGPASQSFALVCEAAAAITGRPADEVRDMLSGVPRGARFYFSGSQIVDQIGEDEDLDGKLEGKIRELFERAQVESAGRR